MTKTAGKHDKDRLGVNHRREHLGRTSTPAQVIEATLDVLLKNQKVGPL
jgi:hypothetical protein